MTPTLFAEALLALALLTGDPEQKPNPELLPLAPAAWRLAEGLDATTLQPWQRGEDGMPNNSFGRADLADWLCQEFWESVTLPPLSDLRLLPGRKAIDAGYHRACQFCHHLEQLLQVDAIHRVELEVYLDEARLLQVVYFNASYALTEGRSGLERRRDLAEVRRLIGDANYYRGQLPPPIPLWRLPEN